MFIPDVCIQIAGVSKAGCDVLLAKLALWLVNVFWLSIGVCLESKIAPNRRLSILFSTRPLVISRANRSIEHTSCS